MGAHHAYFWGPVPRLKYRRSRLLSAAIQWQVKQTQMCSQETLHISRTTQT